MKLSDPGVKCQAYDVSSADKVISPPGYLYIETTGPVEFIACEDSAAVVLPGLTGGMIHPIRVKQVNAAGTTATTVYIFRNGK